MNIEFIIEEPSMEKCLRIIVPKLIGNKYKTSFRIIPVKNKLTLLEKHFKGYLNKDIKIVVLADLDSDDCTELKSNMESAARNIGLVSRSQNEVKFQLINRIVIQELESWYLGDIDAIKIAYPKTKNYLSNALINRNPDYISNTWETLEKILKKAGYHRGGLKKEQAAIDITPYMIPSRNRSRSFQVFRDGLISLINQ